MMTSPSHRRSETAGTCPDADTLSAFAENETSVAEFAFVGRHIQTCAACARAVELSRAHGRAKRVRTTTGWLVTAAAVMVAGLLLSHFARQREFDPALLVAAKVELGDELAGGSEGVSEGAIRELDGWVARDAADAAARRSRALRALQPAFVETGSSPRVEWSFRDQGHSRYLLEPVGPIVTPPESLEFTRGDTAATAVVSRLATGNTLAEFTRFDVPASGQRVDVSAFDWTPGRYFVHTRTADGESDLSSFELRGRAEVQSTLDELDRLDGLVRDPGLRLGLRGLCLWRRGFLQAAMRCFESARPYVDQPADLDRWIEDLRGSLRLPHR